MRKRTIKRVALAVIAIALLAFVLPPFINVNRFKGRIATAMTEALGRKVTVDNVALRLLPQPGFHLERVVIADDPAFGAEPMLRADDVTVSLRLGGLWRGRFEVAKLTLDTGTDINPPSLNLVRAHDGRWNIEALLQRASATPSAPTAQPHAEARPRFPYIEANGGRINFKIGQEKKAYALTDADFALWLASENEWAFRLRATPVRTDFNLSDTGTVRISGRFRRAGSLRETPLELNIEAQDAQLGQLTVLIYGRDRGWRGRVDVNAHVKGTPAGLNLSATAGVRDFRRYDINTTEELRLDVRCTAKYDALNEHLSDLACRLPIGGGDVALKGTMGPLRRPTTYELNVTAENVGLRSLVSLARHVKKDIPDDLSANGTCDAGFSVRREAGDPLPVWAGSVHTSEAVLQSSVLSPDLLLPAITFAVEGPGAESSHDARPRKVVRRRAPQLSPTPDVLRLEADPIELALGTPDPLTLRGWFAREGYEWHVTGDARIVRLVQAARALGLRPLQTSAEGLARVNLQVAGKWSGFTSPTITGTAQLHNVNATVPGVNAPLHIGDATVVLARNAATMQNFTALLSGSPVEFSGSVQVGRGCDTLVQCPIRFDLRSDELSLGSLNRLLNPRYAKRTWYRLFSQERTPLLSLEASGQLSVGRLRLASVSANHVTASAQLRAGKLTLSTVKADVLGGKHQGRWEADFTGGAPEYRGSGKLDGVVMSQVAALARDDWAAGTAALGYRISMTGGSAAELAASAMGSGKFDWTHGVLRHVSLDGRATPLQFKRFAGEMELREGALMLGESKMTTASGIYLVSGVAPSFGRELEVRLRNGGRTYEISGPLEKPKVVVMGNTTQAALNP
ncbi:MAG: AsmA family protein [Terriglobales bacterium]